MVGLIGKFIQQFKKALDLQDTFVFELECRSIAQLTYKEAAIQSVTKYQAWRATSQS